MSWPLLAGLLLLRCWNPILLYLYLMTFECVTNKNITSTTERHGWASVYTELRTIDGMGKRWQRPFNVTAAYFTGVCAGWCLCVCVIGLNYSICIPMMVRCLSDPVTRFFLKQYGLRGALAHVQHSGLPTIINILCTCHRVLCIGLRHRHFEIKYKTAWSLRARIFYNSYGARIRWTHN